MGKIIGWLLTALESRAGSIGVSLLASLGLGFTAYKFTIAPLRDFIASQAGGAPAMAIGILGFLGLDKAVTMILSAIASKYAISGARQILTRRKAA